MNLSKVEMGVTLSALILVKFTLSRAFQPCITYTALMHCETHQHQIPKSAIVFVWLQWPDILNYSSF